MKLISFRWKDRDRIGFAINGDRFADLGEIAEAMGRPPYADMIAVIEAGDEGRAFLRDARDFMRDRPGRVNAIDAKVDYLPSAGAASVEDLRRRVEQLRQQRPQDQRARSSAVLPQAGVVAGRSRPADRSL